MHWYVNVENRAYGPYSNDQMRGFVAEGRVTTASLISNAPANGFHAAGQFDAFHLWSGATQQGTLEPLLAVGAQTGSTAQYASVRQIQQSRQSQQAEPYQARTDSSENMEVTKSSEKSHVFLIMAEIRSSGEMAFLQTMQNFGQAERIGDTVWLVRSLHSVEQIRNTLSQTLNQQDRLFILDSRAGKTAWFNIGADLDHRIRELWDEEET